MADELIVILFALRREMSPFLRRVPGAKRLRDAPCPAWQVTDTLRLLQTGMGAASTQVALEWLFAGDCSNLRLLSTGFCGGLTSDFRVGDLVQPHLLVTKSEKWPIPVEHTFGKSGVLGCADRPLLGCDCRISFHMQTEATVVDMESATVAQMCQKRCVRWESLRVVSDDVRHPLPEELDSILSGESVHWFRLLRASWNRPRLLLDLMGLAKNSRETAEKLADGIQEWLTRVRKPRLPQ